MGVALLPHECRVGRVCDSVEEFQHFMRILQQKESRQVGWWGHVRAAVAVGLHINATISGGFVG